MAKRKTPKSRRPRPAAQPTDDSPAALALPQAMARASTAYRRQSWAEAERLCGSVLDVRPDHLDALNLMGAVAAQTGRMSRAADFFARALAADPESAECCFNLGVVQTELGRLDDALASYDRAVGLQPDHADAHYNRGNVLGDLGRPDEALAAYDRAIRNRPDHPLAHYNRGLVLAHLGRPDEALASFDRAAEMWPDLAEVHNNRGNVLAKLDRFDEALAGYDRALKLDPDNAELYSNRATVLERLGHPEEALAGFDLAIGLDPGDAEIHNNRSTTLTSLRRFDEALAGCDRAIALRPDYAAAHSSRGIVLNRLNRLEEAQASHDRAVALDPGNVEFHSNRGNNLTALRRLDDALGAYRRAIELDPDYGPAHWNLSLLRLLTDDFERGWEGYEWRRKQDREASFARPPWTGKEPLAGRRILLRSEQGFGDTIQFCRYAKDVAALGAQVILEAPEPLRALLDSLEGISEIADKGKGPPEHDCQCPLLSLPRAFGTRLDTIPAGIPYLFSDPARVAAWRDMLGPKDRLRVGLAWSGNASQVNDHNRSIALRDLLPLLVGEVDWLSLHKEVRDGDRDLLASRTDLRHFGDKQEDFSDAAAIIELCDLVVSVDTSLAHLAGAMGKPVWILLPFVPDWRWMLDRDDSPWYPTARLFRQPGTGDWASVIDAVRKALTTRAS